VRVNRALDAVGLSDLLHHRPHTLSGGEKRRLAIAGVLAMEPKVLVFDEPFSNLDDPGIRQVLSQIAALHASGHTIIITTHDLEKAIAHADRLIVMDNGRIQRDGNPAAVVADIAEFGVRAPCSYIHKGTLDSWLA
jgi:biotin transport system ATP-binding protein